MVMSRDLQAARGGGLAADRGLVVTQARSRLWPLPEALKAVKSRQDYSGWRCKVADGNSPKATL